ncbi:MAG: hypothetical protein GY854_10315 [Deltaproteobacteria bacterium]|nr:hypothetical protein [Deltaproteobacteria bacterium]
MHEKAHSIFLLILAALAAAVAACTNIGDFSTDENECYEGQIVEVQYVRSKTLDAETVMTMTLDSNALGQGDEGATITTDDGTFNGSKVSQMEQLTHDSLSMLQFPGGRVRNYLAYARPTRGSPATIVISLMENDEVEVRVMRPDFDANDNEDSSLFGVFRLVRKELCSVEE